MKCFYHINQDAVASCYICNRFICAQCSENGYKGICWYCYQSKEQELRQKYLMLGKRSIPEMKKTAVLTSIAYSLVFGILGFTASVSYLTTAEEKNYLLAIVGFLISPYLGFSLHWTFKGFYDSSKLREEREQWLNQNTNNVVIVNYWGDTDGRGLLLYYLFKFVLYMIFLGLLIIFFTYYGTYYFLVIL